MFIHNHHLTLIVVLGTLFFFCKNQRDSTGVITTQPDSLMTAVQDSVQQDTALSMTDLGDPELPCWSLGFTNAFDCAEQIEAEADQKYGHLFNKQDNQVVLTLKNGKILTIKDTVYEGWGKTRHFFYDYIPAIDFFVLRVFIYEGGWYKLVHALTGRTYLVNGFPVISPDSSRFAVAQVDLESGYDPNTLALYEVKGDLIHQVFKRTSKTWGASHPRWINSTTVQVVIHTLQDRKTINIDKRVDYLYRTYTGWALKADTTTPLYLGVISPRHTGKGPGGFPFYGYFSENAFTSINDNVAGEYRWISFANKFPTRISVEGINCLGRQFHFTIKQAVVPDGAYEPWLIVDRRQNVPVAGQNPILFTTRDSILAHVTWQPVSMLDPLLEKFFKGKVDSMFHVVVEEREEIERFTYCDLQEPTVKKVEWNQTEYLFINFPLRLWGMPQNPTQIDRRATVFFLYDLTTRTVVRSAFGHPAWSPEAEKVLTIEPYMLFTLKGYNNLLCLCDYSYGWEHMGYAIIDVVTGKVLLETLS